MMTAHRTATRHVDEATPFWRLLRELRLARDLGMKQLAWRMADASGRDWDLSTISRWESGERAPTLESLAALSDALELDEAERFALFASAQRLEYVPTDAQLARIWAAIVDEIGAAA